MMMAPAVCKSGVMAAAIILASPGANDATPQQ
jgi:hypothetical protein